MKRIGVALALAAVLATACDGAPAREEGIPKMTIRIEERGTDSQNDFIFNSLTLTDSTSFAGVRVDITGLRQPLTLRAADFKKNPQRNHVFIIPNIPQEGTAVVNVQLT